MPKKYIVYDDVEPVTELPLNDIEIAEGASIDKVEIYMLDAEGNRIEGGTFDRNEFINYIRKFYDDNY